jgi:UPF0716 family protein affecting phage T7 exclusion
MRLLGVLLVLSGGAGTVWSITAATTRRRPLDVVAALVAPLAILAALIGGVLVLVPGFLR